MKQNQRKRRVIFPEKDILCDTSSFIYHLKLIRAASGCGCLSPSLTNFIRNFLSVMTLQRGRQGGDVVVVVVVVGTSFGHKAYFSKLMCVCSVEYALITDSVQKS